MSRGTTPSVSPIPRLATGPTAQGLSVVEEDGRYYLVEGSGGLPLVEDEGRILIDVSAQPAGIRPVSIGSRHMLTGV